MGNRDCKKRNKNFQMLTKPKKQDKSANFEVLIGMLKPLVIASICSQFMCDNCKCWTLICLSTVGPHLYSLVGTWVHSDNPNVQII